MLENEYVYATFAHPCTCFLRWCSATRSRDLFTVIFCNTNNATHTDTSTTEEIGTPIDENDGGNNDPINIYVLTTIVLSCIICLIGIGCCWFCFNSASRGRNINGLSKKPVGVASVVSVPPDSPVDVSVIKNDFASSSTPVHSNHYDNYNKNEKQTSPRSDENLLDDAYDDEDEDQLYEPMEPETAGKFNGNGNVRSTNATVGVVNQAGGEGNDAGDGLASSEIGDEGSQSDSMYDNGVNHDDSVTEGGRNSHVNDLERVTSMSGESAGGSVRFSSVHVAARVSGGYKNNNNNNNDGNYSRNKHYSTRSSKTATATGTCTGTGPRTHALSDIGSDGDIINEDLHDYIGTAGGMDKDNINDLVINDDLFDNGVNDDNLEIENINYDPNKLPYRASRAEGMASNVNSGKLTANANLNSKASAGGNAGDNGDAINTVGSGFAELENDAALDAISTNPGPAFNQQRRARAKDSIDEVFDPAPANGSLNDNDNSKGSNDLTTVTENETPQTDNGKTHDDNKGKNNGNEDQQNQKVDSIPLAGAGNII